MFIFVFRFGSPCKWIEFKQSLFILKMKSRKVTIGQPSTSKDDSDSDSGTKVNSETTNKSVDPWKEMRTEQKKQAYMACKLCLNIIAEDYWLKLSFYIHKSYKLSFYSLL